MKLRPIHLAQLSSAYGAAKEKIGIVRSNDYHKDGNIASFLQNIDDFEVLEPMKLPAVTMLYSYAGKYATMGLDKVAGLYKEGPAPKLIGECLLGQEEEFTLKILPYLDEVLISAFIDYINATEDEAKKLRTECDKKERSIKKEEKKLEPPAKKNQEEASKQAELAPEDKEKIEEKIKKLKGEKEKLDSQLTAVEQKLTSIQRFKLQLMKRAEVVVEEINSGMNSAMELLRQMNLSKDEIVLKQFIATGIMDPEYAELLAHGEVTDKFINVMNRPEYRQYVLEIIIRLYHEEIIDLLGPDGVDPTNKYYLLLKDNGYSFCETLVNNFPQSLDGINEDNDYCTLFEIAVFQDTERAIDNAPLAFGRLWSCIEDPEIWKWIIEIAMAHDESHPEKILATFIGEIQGRTATAFLDAFEVSGIAEGALVKALLSQQKTNSDVLLMMFNRLDKVKKRTETKLKRVERATSKQPTMVYRAMSQPVELLEYLTVNLKNTSVPVSNEVIVNQLEGIVEKLRDGLRELNVETVEDIEKWKNQTTLTFDTEKHSFEQGASIKSENVRLNTLGFSYSSDGEMITYPAKVVAMEGE